MGLLRYRRHSGFTLVEMVIVIIVLGIVSVYAMSRFSDRGAFAAKSIQDEMVGSLRAAQQVAMSRAASDLVQFELTPGQYDVTVNGASQFSGPHPFTGITTIPANATVIFNKRGATTPVTIQIVGSTFNICVESSGFAHGC